MAESDQAILAALRDGAPDAIARAYAAHGAMVYGTCRRVLRDPALAQDATQAVFLLLWRKGRMLPAGTTLAGWCHRAAELAARTELRGELRRKRREHEAAATGGQPAAMAEEPAPAPDGELRARLDAALERLSEPQRLALILVHLEGRPREEAAALLGVTDQTLRKRLSDGLAKLRGLLGARGAPIAGAVALAMLEESARAAAPPTPLGTAIEQLVARAATGAPAPSDAGIAELATAADPTHAALPLGASAIGLTLVLAALAAAGAGLGMLERARQPAAPQEPTVAPTTERAIEQAPNAAAPELPPGPPAMLGEAQTAQPNGGTAVLWSRNRWGNYPLATYDFERGLRGDHPDVGNGVELVFGNLRKPPSFTGAEVDAFPGSRVTGNGSVGWDSIAGGGRGDEPDLLRVDLYGGCACRIDYLGAIDYAKLAEPPPLDQSTMVRVAVGHTYVIGWRIGQQPERFAKLRVLAHRFNDAIAIEWAPLAPPTERKPAPF